MTNAKARKPRRHPDASLLAAALDWAALAAVIGFGVFMAVLQYQGKLP